MVALFNQQLIVWYLITLKLRETIKANHRDPQEKPIARPIYLGLHKYNPVLRPLPMAQPPPPLSPPLSPTRSPPRPRPVEVVNTGVLSPLPTVKAGVYPVLPPPCPQVPPMSAPGPLLPQRRPSPPRTLPPPPPPMSAPGPLPQREPRPQPPPRPRELSPPREPRPQPPPPPFDSPWIFSILEELDHARQYEASSPWNSQSIYRVPKSLRDVDRTAYTPKIVSIGPYHHGRRRFRSMERHKWRSLHRALYRRGHDVHLYLEAARSLEGRARSCYEAPISISSNDFSSNDFIKCLVLDSIFALELFRGVALEGFQDLGYSPNDPVFAVRGIMHSFQRDMLLLENQLPLFVLDWMLALQLDYDPSSSYRVAPLALRFFEPLKPTYDLLSTTASPSPLNEVESSRALHCLDVFRLSLLRPPTPASRPWLCFRGNQSAPPVHTSAPSTPASRPWLCFRGNQPALATPSPHPIADKRRQQLIHCVADLRKAGIKFRSRKSDRFWDIKFKCGVLYIPRLLIHDGTKSLFLNLIAFEQCHLQCGNRISSYVTFMDNLINSEVDVGFLHDKQIIEHWLGNDGEVAAMFNRLCEEVVFDRYDCYLSEVSWQVNRYYHNKCNNWRASFTHKYFSNPWTFMSLVAAVVLLLLTAAQTFYTVYAYYKPK